MNEDEIKTQYGEKLLAYEKAQAEFDKIKRELAREIFRVRNFPERANLKIISVPDDNRVYFCAKDENNKLLEAGSIPLSELGY